MRSTMRDTMRLLALLLLVAALPGCSCGTLNNTEFDRRYPYGRGTLFTQRGIVEFSEKVERRLGGNARVTSLSIYPSYASFTAESPQHAGDFDAYSYRDGAMKATAMQDPSSSLGKALFELHAVALDKVPELVRAAVRELGLTQGHAVYVMIGLVSEQLVIRVYCEEERHSGSVEYDAAGKLLKVDKN